MGSHVTPFTQTGHMLTCMDIYINFRWPTSSSRKHFEIQPEKEKSKALQEELDEHQIFYEELRCKYEAGVTLVRQEAKTKVLLSEEQRLLENLRAEKDDMFQEMSQKIAFLQDSDKLLQEELNQIKHKPLSYNELNCNYESDVSGLKQDVETYQQEKDANLEGENENLQLINNLRAEKEELFQKMSREITILQKRDKQMLNELDQVARRMAST
ncbi:hypothetical protein CCH79_00013288, partial [Gambusia affinis]